MLFKFISQKIKKIFNYFKSIFTQKPTLIDEAIDKKQQILEKVYPEKVDLCCENLEFIIEYVLKIANIKRYSSGVSIIVCDVDSLSGLNTVMNLVCTEFKYVTIYTENVYSAGAIADYVYAKFGLPIMVLGIEESARCRYPVIIDFVNNKLRYGRDVCITGTAKEKSGKTVGVYIGDRLVRTVI